MSHRALHGDRSVDHPTRESSDHANLDPRNHPKHPKVRAAGRSANRPERRSDRAA